MKCYAMRLVITIIQGMFSRYKRQLIVICVCLSFIILIQIHQRESKTLLINNTSEELISLRCSDVLLEKNIEYRGNYLILKNFIRAEHFFKCGESITLTTPGDFRFLDNIEPLVDRWHGPISVALYAPGFDFYSTLNSIAYLRQCTTPLVKLYVTFHIFFDVGHMPNETNQTLLQSYKDEFDCNQKPPYEIMGDYDMYKQQVGLFYPINVARNIAKINAATYFVFPSDIELYPTRNFIQKFFEFMKRKPEYFGPDSRNVFVFPLFEILEFNNVPETKTSLQKMLNNGTAFLFHYKVCRICHLIPKLNEWVKAKETNGVDIFTSDKRLGPQRVWEPFFICTQNEPLWDERLNWEGQGNKMSQVYHLCLLDYNFLIFDNAFLIHKPGVKKKKVQNLKYKDQQRKNNKILMNIREELINIYGTNNFTSQCMIVLSKNKYMSKNN